MTKFSTTQENPMDKQQDHVEVLRELLLPGRGISLDEHKALTTAISALTVDAAMLRRACTAYNRAEQQGRVRNQEGFMLAALQAAIHGESQ